MNETIGCERLRRFPEYIYPGGLRPDRRAPGDFAEEGAFQNIFVTEICLRILILLNTFFCVFLETFSSGGVPPDTCFIDF